FPYPTLFRSRNGGRARGAELSAGSLRTVAQASLAACETYWRPAITAAILLRREDNAVHRAPTPTKDLGLSCRRHNSLPRFCYHRLTRHDGARAHPAVSARGGAASRHAAAAAYLRATVPSHGQALPGAPLPLRCCSGAIREHS